MAPNTTDHFTSKDRAREQAREALMPVAVPPINSLWDWWVSVLRNALPVLAAIISVITLAWPFVNEREVSFTLSKDDVAKSDGAVRMTNLRYTGTDAIDRLFVVEASSGLQENPSTQRIRLQDISARMDLEPGNEASVTARTGIFRLKDGTMSLVGGVRVATDNGYSLEMAGAEVDLKAHVATGQGQIEGKTPLGTLKAGQMEIQVDEARGIFDGGVKLHITPKRRGEGQQAGNGK